MIPKYLNQRRKELREKVNPNCLDVFEVSYDFIEERICSEHKDVDPSVTRRVQILEALMFSFIEHGMNMSLLEQMDEFIKDTGSAGVQ